MLAILNELLELEGLPPISSLHSHRCPGCSHVWEHDGAKIKSQAENVAAHTCPKCGNNSDLCYKKFHG